MSDSIGPDSVASSAPTGVTNTGSNMENLDFVRNVLFIFLSATAFLVTLLIVAYIGVVTGHRYFRCCKVLDTWLEGGDGTDVEGEDNAVDTAGTVTPSAEAYGPVAFKARLWGLSKEERRCVLERVFADYSLTYTSPENGGEENVRRVPEPGETVENKPGKAADSHDDFDDIESGEEQDMSEKRSENINYSDRSSDRDKEGGGVSDCCILDERRTCAICLGIYKNGDRIMHGVYCNHQFHYACIMEWMENCHDHCPYCRIEMMKPVDMRYAASQLLDSERLEELSWVGKCTVSNHMHDMTNSPLSNVSDGIHRWPTRLSPRDVFSSRRYHDQNSTLSQSPALSDQAQLGQMIGTVTPLHERDQQTPGSSDTGDIEKGVAGDNDLTHVREALDNRLIESVDVATSNTEKPLELLNDEALHAL